MTGVHPERLCSVVIATRGRGPAVVDALTSVLASDVDDLHVVVVDQSVDDTTERAVEPFLGDARVTYLRSDTVGLSRARNVGIAVTQSALVMITDDDCVVPPEWVRAMVRPFEADPTVGVVFCSVAAAPPPPDEIGHTPAVVFETTRTMGTVRDAWKAGRRGLPLGAGMAVRRTTFEELDGFDELLGAGARFGAAEDSDLSWRGLRSGWTTVYDADVTVMHYGFRNLDELRRLVVRDFYGVGGAIAKYLRTPGMRVGAIGFLLSWLFHFGVRLPILDVKRGQRPRGFRRPVMLLRGVLDGLRTPLEATHVVYVEGAPRPHMTIGSADVIAGSVVTTDVCIVGGGAAGITLARQLDALGLDALVLEAGRLRPQTEAGSGRDEVELLGLPWPNPEPSRGFGFGGSTRYWFGRIAMPDPIDFEVRDWVPFSGWPVELAELRPWTEVAARVLEVPDFRRIDIRTWPQSATVETFRDRDGSNLGVFLWSEAADMGRRHRRTMEQSSTISVLLDATAVELVPTERADSIASLHVAGPGGDRFTVEAHRFVLASGGLDNARLLLASTSRSPNGVGNDHDLVGRFYMDHPRGEGLASADLTGLDDTVIDRVADLGERTPSKRGKFQFCVTFSDELQRREGLLNHALHAHLVTPVHDSAAFRSAHRLRQRNRRDRESTFIDDSWAVLKGSPALLGLAARMATGRSHPSRIVFIDQMEQVPDPDSRVTVDRRAVDRWGLPHLKVDWRVGRSTYDSQRRMHELVRGILARSGIADFRSVVLDDPDHDPVVWDMKHPSGTTRMASTPLDGVVDAECKVHGVDNLYVVGSSVFPTVGHFNPTLVIVALAARLAANLATTRRGVTPERPVCRARLVPSPPGGATGPGGSPVQLSDGVEEVCPLGVSPSYIWHSGRSVLNARWSLRRADHVGSRVRMSGRAAVRNLGRMTIGDRVQLISTVATLELVSEADGVLEIADRTLVNFGCSLVATELVRIGEDCHIGPYTMMLDNEYHRIEPERRLERPPSKPIVVERNVWVGARVIVMAGVTIGQDSVVGAGSVVTHDVPPRTLVVGVPARVIRSL